MNNEHTHDIDDGPRDEPSRMYDLLCRYVFGEATEAEGAEVEKALLGSEELRAQKAELDATVALVQGAFVSEKSAANESLSAAQMGELQDAARASAGAESDFELKPVLRGPRPWYAQSAVRFAAAATVLLGVGAHFAARSGDTGSAGEPFSEATVQVSARSEVPASVPDAAMAPSPPAKAVIAIEGAPEPIAEEFEVADAAASSMKHPGTATSLAEKKSMSESLRSLGYGGGVQSSSDDFFLGRGEALQDMATELDAASSQAKRSMGAPGGAQVASDMVSVSNLEHAKEALPDYFRASGTMSKQAQAPAEAPRLFSESERMRPARKERPRDMFFRFWGDNPFVITRSDGLSTFAADVDTASFALARSMLRKGILPKRDQIRTEEFVNYAAPDLAAPTDGTFAVYSELSPSPFGGREDRWLLRVGVRAKDMAPEERPPLALTFVVDTSGSMGTDNRLELVKHALRLLVGQLDGRDTISIVGFSDRAVEVLPPTPASASDAIETALFGLQPGGGTNAEAGLKLGYAQVLSAGAAPGAQRRVIFLSDGVANLGQADQNRLAVEVAEYADQGVFLNTIGVGMSNHNDLFLEQLANKGQGVCDYVGDAADARRAIVERFVSGFVTVAKDLKIQVEFDGQAVLRWRQLGYENRAVADRNFRSDAVDAGEVGAGHQVTCFYELELASAVSEVDVSLAKVRLRWKPIDPSESEAGVQETEHAFSYRGIVAPSFRAASPGFRLGALSAQFAELLRRSYHARGDSMERLAKGFANLLSDAPSKDVGSMAEALTLAKQLGLKALPAPQGTDSDAAQQEAYYQSLIETLGGAEALHPEDAIQDETQPGPRTPEAYEKRIRELLNGDREKRQD